MSDELNTANQFPDPRDRPVGSKNKATQLTEAMNSHNPEAISTIVGRVTDAAMRGERWAIELLFDKLYPVPESRAVTFPMPPINSAADVLEALNGRGRQHRTGDA
jgi:hypothetical protein